MEIDVVLEAQEWAPVGLEQIAQTALSGVVARLGLTLPVEVALLACDDARIAALNADFRDKPTPTNVLSWPAEDLAPDTPGGQPARPEPDPFGDATALGDIALAYETCASEAATAQKPFNDHVMHLIVHGLLHLLGYDHETDADAALMEGLEVEILADMGLASPYSVD